MKQILNRSLIVFFLFLAAMNISFGQITGDLRGSVADGSGSAIPGAKVTLKSLETGQVRTTEVGGDGTFSFPLLKIGLYEVNAESTGFRTSSAQAEVKTGEISTVRFVLEVGSISETVEVTADAVVLLDAENSQMQTSIVGEKIQEIPVARNPNNFAITAPGTSPVSANNPFLGSGSFNSNGGRGRGNNITVDGITATDVSVTGTGGTLNPLNFASIKEVKIITNNFSAEYGRNASAQVIYATKNGTNELRGEVFEYFRNDALNARPFFDTSGKTNKLRHNEYGYSLGGPVLIPKIFNGKNKVFWQTDFQQHKIRGAGQSRIANVPTPEQAAGITDPSALALFQQYQVPTSPSRTLQTSAPNMTNFWQYAIRGDFNLGNRDSVWLRYSQADSNVASTSNTFINTNLPGFGASSSGQPRQATGAHTHLFGSSAVNEFRFGFGESNAGFAIDTPYPLGPRIQFGDGSVNSFGVWEGLPQGRSQKTYQFTNNFSYVAGRHNLKFGGEWYYLVADSTFDALTRGLFVFANFADFQQGRPTQFQQRFGDSARFNRVKNFFAFAQDDFKVTRNFTLNLGMRVEWAGGPYETRGMTSNLYFENQTPYGAAGAGPFGLMETGKPSFNSTTNWAPRVGFAWSPGGGKTVIRGGYGIAYDFIFLNPITNQRFLPPFIVTGALTGVNSFTGNNSLASILAGTSTIQTTTAATAGTLSQTARNFGALSPIIDPNLRNPQIHQWNFGLQRDMLGIVFKASYVGTKGNYLLRSRDINFIANRPAPATSLEDEQARLSQFTSANQAQSGNVNAVSNRIDPRYNGIVRLDNSANSNYHALQFEAQKRIGSTFLLNANYTYAKSIDDGSDALGVLVGDGSNQQNPLDNRNNRAPSQFDLRHRVVIMHSWEPGWFKGSSNWAVKNLVGNWVFSGITSFRTGYPLTLLAGNRLSIAGSAVYGGGGDVRPNIAGPLNIAPKPIGSEGSYSGTIPGGAGNGQAISTYAQSLGLSQPLLGNFGSLGRNIVRMNGERNFDWTIAKNFSVSDRARFQVRGEFYNIFNNTSFLEIDRNITSPNFGNYTTVSQDSRMVQLVARFIF